MIVFDFDNIRQTSPKSLYREVDLLFLRLSLRLSPDNWLLFNLCFLFLLLPFLQVRVKVVFDFSNLTIKRARLWYSWLLLIFLLAAEAAKLAIVLNALRFIDFAQTEPTILVAGYISALKMVQLSQLNEFYRIGWLDILYFFDRILALIFIYLTFYIWSWSSLFRTLKLDLEEIHQRFYHHLLLFLTYMHLLSFFLVLSALNRDKYFFLLSIFYDILNISFTILGFLRTIDPRILLGWRIPAIGQFFSLLNIVLNFDTIAYSNVFPVINFFLL